MNNEIKEIFKEWKQFLSWCYENNDKTVEIHRDKIEYVMDYITNLQQENERLKEELVKIPRAKMEYDLELEDYKSRCEKASELIDLKITRLYHEVDYNLGIEDLKDIDNILQNGSDEE